MPALVISLGSSGSVSASNESTDSHSTAKVVKWTREAETKAVQDIEREDAARRAKQQRAEDDEKQAIESERIRVRAEIERKVREEHWQKSNTEFQSKVTQKKQEREHLHLTQAPASVAKIQTVNEPVPRIRDANELAAKFGYNVVYNKMFEGKYWRMLQAKKRDAPDQMYALLIMDMSKVSQCSHMNTINLILFSE